MVKNGIYCSRRDLSFSGVAKLQHEVRRETGVSCLALACRKAPTVGRTLGGVRRGFAVMHAENAAHTETPASRFAGSGLFELPDTGATA